MKIKSVNPSTYQIIDEVEASTQAGVDRAIEKARQAQTEWAATPVEERAKKVASIIDIVKKNTDKLAMLTASEMGMPISEARDDIVFGLEYLQSYVDTAGKLLVAETTFEDGKELHRVYHEPRGVVAVIVPWNFPFGNFVWGAGQNLVAGNTVVLKHSEETILFSKELAKLIDESDLPSGVFNVVYGAGEVGDMLAHADIDMLCFTGSTKTGQYLSEVCGQKFIPFLAELGGSAPGIVFEDTDVSKIVDNICFVRFLNCGQMCDALKRLIVHESKLDEVVAMIQHRLSSKVIGPATDDKTTLGPLAAKRQLDLLVEQVADAVDKQANVVCGGKRPKGMEGAFYEPTILTNVNSTMRVWREEVFGPVLPVVAFKTEQEAIDLANDTMYGLGGYVFTQDKQRFDRVAAQMQTGMVSHNNINYVRPSNPFGGYKKSGIGREHAQFGFHDVTQVKVISREK